MDGVVNGLPVPNKVPPVAALYHLSVDTPVADSVTVPVPQRPAPVATGAASPAPKLVSTEVAVFTHPVELLVTVTE